MKLRDGLIAATIFLAAIMGEARAADKPDILEIITIAGEIDGGTAVEVTKEVDRINENKRVKAVLLIVDTPGGGAIASSAIYEELGKLKVPVVGWCDSLCASGGMYVLMAPSVKYVGVRSETISGSIGVIMHVMRFNRLLDWAHIDSETYKSGPVKDAGSPFKAAEDYERAYLQGIVSELASRFYSIVEKSRGTRIKDWQAVREARIFIGDQGVKVGLVDEVMKAKNKAKQLSGSSLIFTRDEIKKMSKDGDSPNRWENEPPLPAPRAQGFGDVAWLIEELKRIESGSSVVVKYRMPYQL